MKASLRELLLTSIVVTVLIGVTMTISSTIFSLSAAAPMAFGESIVLDSEQSVTTVTTTTNVIDQDNSTTDRHTSSLRITQSPENGLDVECGGDLKCEILENNTVVATAGENTSATMLSGALKALTQSLNQSSIILPPFGDNDFDILNRQEEEDLDSELDQWIDRILNDTLGDLRAPLQTPPDLRSVSV